MFKFQVFWLGKMMDSKNCCYRSGCPYHTVPVTQPYSKNIDFVTVPCLAMAPSVCVSVPYRTVTVPYLNRTVPYRNRNRNRTLIVPYRDRTLSHCFQNDSWLRKGALAVRLQYGTDTVQVRTRTRYGHKVDISTVKVELELTHGLKRSILGTFIYNRRP